jgi:hypothetical protein
VAHIHIPFEYTTAERRWTLFFALLSEATRPMITLATSSKLSIRVPTRIFWSSEEMHP